MTMASGPRSRSVSPAAQKSGSLIAIEGDIQTVSTQLRLLPPSSKILVLPPLLDDVASRVEDAPFNARSFVRDVHAAFTTRAETARSFLRPSTHEHPRLVFMNGGSVCAKTTCIANICENVTNGQIREAEALFQDIVKDGVAGLLRLDDVDEAGHESAEDKDKQAEGSEGHTERDVRSPSDAGSAAMKAADNLDRDTAELQPSNDDEMEDAAIADAAHHSEDVQQNGSVMPSIDHADVGSRKNSMASSQRSIKMDRAVFTNEHGSPIRQTIISMPRRPSQPVEDDPQRSADVSQHDSTTMSPDDTFSPNTEDNHHSTPATPGAVVEYGEAYIIDVQSANPAKKLKRSQSVNRIHKRQNHSPSSPTSLKHSSSNPDLRKRSIDSDERPSSRDSYETLPRSTFMRASQFTIRRSPTAKKNAIAPPPKVFVDRGTDAEPMDAAEAAQAVVYEPVFPVIEDLVIHFHNSMVNEIFDSVVRAYKDGSYPVYPPKAQAETAIAQLDEATMPEALEEAPTTDERPFSHLTAETDDDGYQRRQEVDPYNPDSYQAGAPLWPSQRKTKNVATVRAEPPTPATTPPPVLSEVAQKFHEFSPVNANSAVGVQNSLRAVLNVHYGPAETTKYKQYDLPLECDRLWKPVFRNDNGQGTEGRTVDQILAIGCEDGVSSEFFNDISGQIEKLGIKKNGSSRTGRLDIRYLIATAMQSHTMLPLAAQSVANPFGNPMTLATSLVPPLETYLSVNHSVRFLVLTYPASHLATVISLRKILGSDLLKVSGIIDALASDPPSFAGRASPPPPLTLLSNEGAASLNNRTKPAMSIGSFARTRAELARQASAAHAYSISNASSKRSSSQTDPSFSFAKANHLLPSTATDAEIATFLSSIWKNLIEKSAWYAPEPPSPVTATAVPEPVTTTTLLQPPPIPPTPANQTAENAPRSPLPASSFGSQKRKPIPQSHSNHNTGKQSKVDQLLGNTSSSRSNALSSEASAARTAPAERTTTTHVNGRAPSVTTVKTTNSEKERRDDKAWENFYLGPDGESDDEFERMFMPRLPKKTEKKKGNSRKALKWLGLA